MDDHTEVVEQIQARDWAAWRDQHEAVVLDVREAFEWAWTPRTCVAA